MCESLHLAIDSIHYCNHLNFKIACYVYMIIGWWKLTADWHQPLASRAPCSRRLRLRYIDAQLHAQTLQQFYHRDSWIFHR